MKRKPSLFLGLLEKGWCLEELSAEAGHSFAKSWQKRSRFTWAELASHGKHGLGSEKLPLNKIRPAAPRILGDEKEVLVFRYMENLPVAGIQFGDVFAPLWIEREYGDLYDHG